MTIFSEQIICEFVIDHQTPTQLHLIGNDPIQLILSDSPLNIITSIVRSLNTHGLHFHYIFRRFDSKNPFMFLFIFKSGILIKVLF